MHPEDRIDFMQNMMPRCMNMIFSELEPTDRKDLAQAMLDHMMHKLNEQVNS